MKELYLTFNPVTSLYIFVDGKNQYSEKREEIRGEEVLHFTKSRINLKRKTLLHLVDCPLDRVNCLREFFENTKIQITETTYHKH